MNVLGSDYPNTGLVWAGNIEPCSRVDGHTPSNRISHPGPSGRLFLFGGTMKEISLANGGVALVDDDDYEKLLGKRWRRSTRGYAHWNTTARRPGERRTINLSMVKVITGCPDGMTVDHIDGNRLNNQKSNLRICTMGENLRNKGIMQTNKSGYKGVSWNKRYSVWVAQITHERKNMHIGYFDTKEEAHKAYCEKAKELHGEFARFE